jgi:hypothetical protein
MYVVSELVKVYGDEPSADVSMAPILSQLLGASCSGEAEEVEVADGRGRVVRRREWR